MYRGYIQKNVTSVSIILFLIIFFCIQSLKPSFIYNNDGSFRRFGLGTKNKTVIPIWFITLIIAILSYVFILYYINIHNFNY